MEIRFNIPEPPVPRYECRMTEKARPSRDWMCASKPVVLRDERRMGVRATARTNWLRLCFLEKLLLPVGQVIVPQTDTGRRVEYTKALEITLVKELGKLAP